MEHLAPSKQELKQDALMCRVAVREERRQYYLSREHLSSFRHKLCLSMISFYRALLLVEPNNIHRAILSTSFCRRKHEGKLSRQQRVRIKNIWPIVVLATYVLITAKFCAYTYLKFQQDSYRFKLEHLNQSTDAKGIEAYDYIASRADIDSKRADYEEKLRDVWRHLKQIGDPYTASKFIAQVSCIVLIAVTFVLYPCTQIFCNYLAKFEYPLVRLLLHEPEEYAHRQRLIDLELKRLANSSRNFLWWTCRLASVGAQECTDHVHKQLEQQIRYISANDRADDSQVRRLRNICTSMGLQQSDGVARYLQDHCKLTRQLLQLRRSKRLHPINRVSEEWTSRNEFQFVKMNIVNTFYSLILDTLLIYVGHLFTYYQLEFVTLADRLLIVDGYFYCMLGVFATNYHMSLFVIDCDDKTRYMKHMRQQLIDCIRDNDRKFALLYECLTATCYRQHKVDQNGFAEHQLFETCSNELNSKLVKVYLQYRIFLTQVNEAKRYWWFAIIVGMMVMFITPIFARIYIPYITDVSANLSVIGYSLSLAIFTDIFLLPLCMFSKYGESTYKTMCSLLAHCMELQVKSREELAYGPIYMEHMIGVLRRELDDPDEFLARFSFGWLGITATFATLVKLHIYYGLALLSLFFVDSTWRALLGDRLNDPLGLLKT